MSEWTADITVQTPVELDEGTLIELAHLVGDEDATVARAADVPGYAVTLDVEAPSFRDALDRAVAWATSLRADLAGVVVDARVTTPERYEADALRPSFPPLASAADAAEILGVSRQRVHQLAASNTRFPAPVARVGTGPLWTVPAIEHFAKVWDRRPGRRPADPDVVWHDPEGLVVDFTTTRGEPQKGPHEPSAHLRATQPVEAREAHG